MWKKLYTLFNKVFFLINRNGYEINKLDSFKSVFKGIKNAVNRFINSQHLVTRIPMRSKHGDQTDGNSWVTEKKNINHLYIYTDTKDNERIEIISKKIQDLRGDRYKKKKNVSYK